MVAISFGVFKDKLIDGSKRQTIRRYKVKRYDQLKKVLNKPDGLQIYWHQRQKDSEKLMGGTLTELFIFKFCKYTQTTTSEIDYAGTKNYMFINPYDGSLNKFAQMDGFGSWAELVDWFKDKYGEDFYKQEFTVIRWKTI